MEEIKNNSEIKGSNKLLFIRHGISEFNYINRKDKETGVFTIDKYATDEMMDAPLHSIGIEQAIEKRPFVENISVEYVFVSIFRRALETSYLLFQNHPNRDKIRMIVHPLIGEKFHCNHDVMRDFASIREKFESKTELTYDFTLFDAYEHPRLYYIYEINDPPREQLLKRILEGKEKEQEVFLEMAKGQDLPLETYANCIQRGARFIDYLKNFVKARDTHNCTFVIITHSQFFRHFSATEVTKEESDPINGCRMTNLDHTIYEDLNQLPNKLIYK